MSVSSMKKSSFNCTGDEERPNYIFPPSTKRIRAGGSIISGFPPVIDGGLDEPDLGGQHVSSPTLQVLILDGNVHMLCTHEGKLVFSERKKCVTALDLIKYLKQIREQRFSLSAHLFLSYHQT